MARLTSSFLFFQANREIHLNLDINHFFPKIVGVNFFFKGLTLNEHSTTKPTSTPLKQQHNHQHCYCWFE